MAKGKYKYFREDYANQFVVDVIAILIDSVSLESDVHEKLVDVRNYLYDKQKFPDDDIWEYDTSYYVNRFTRIKRKVKQG